MNKYTGLLAAGLIALLSGCDSNSSNNRSTPPPPPPPPAGEFRVQLLHASPDAPAVNITGIGAAINGVDYKVGSGAIRAPAGFYTGVQIDGIVPGGTSTVVGPLSISFRANVLYSVLAIGDVANIDALVLEQPDTDVPAGSTRLRIVHAAPDAPEVSVFLTAPGADLQTEAAVGTFEFGGDLGPVDVPAGGPYQIRVTLPFTPPAVETVVFDSGEITLADGANLLITAVENTTSADALATEESPISLIVLDGMGSSEILSAGSPAELRVVHASADAPPVDVVVNDNFMMPLVPGLEYPSFAPATGFVSVPADSYDITVTDSATQSVFPIDVDGLSLAAGVTYDVLAVNTLALLEPLILEDDYRRLATAAKLRIVHASTVADGVSPSGVDIYITAPNTDIATVDPELTDIVFKANTGFLEFAEGSYEVTVTAAGSKTPAIPTTPVSIENGKIYTAIARDPDPMVLNDGLGLILMDDFVTP